MSVRPDDPTYQHARTQTITGLRALADYLEANPDIPICEAGVDYSVFAHRTNDTTERAQIDTIAKALQEPVHDETGDGGHYSVTKIFGRITYRATHIPARLRAVSGALEALAECLEQIYAINR